MMTTTTGTDRGRCRISALYSFTNKRRSKATALIASFSSFMVSMSATTITEAEKMRTINTSRTTTMRRRFLGTLLPPFEMMTMVRRTNVLGAFSYFGFAAAAAATAATIANFSTTATTTTTSSTTTTTATAAAATTTAASNSTPTVVSSSTDPPSSSSFALGHVQPYLLATSATGNSESTTPTSSSLKSSWFPSPSLSSSSSSMISPLSASSTLTASASPSPSSLLLEEVDASEEEEESESSTTLTNTTRILNWSGTHAVTLLNEHYHEPETVKDVERIVRTCHHHQQQQHQQQLQDHQHQHQHNFFSIRPVGSALSPNALAFQKRGMISLVHLDQVIRVDAKKQTVTVQAGAKVRDVLEALRPYHLTLPTLASIAEQQMGGFVSVGAHGTGAHVAPIDHYVTSVTYVTPAHGKVTFTPSTGTATNAANANIANDANIANIANATDDDVAHAKTQNRSDEEETKNLCSVSIDADADADDADAVVTTIANDALFHLVKVGLGCVGIMVELTVQCIPAHALVERTFVLTRKEAVEQLDQFLTTYKHVRYMWIPYTDAVVVVTNHPAATADAAAAGEEEEEKDNKPVSKHFSFSKLTSRTAKKQSIHRPNMDEKQQLKPMKDLLLQISKEYSEKMKVVKVGCDIPPSDTTNTADTSATTTAPPTLFLTAKSLKGMGFADLRDALLAFDPLNVEHVKRCNAAEAAFWHNRHGLSQTQASDALLQFDCGGQQWVQEVCFPTSRIPCGERGGGEQEEEEEEASVPDNNNNHPYNNNHNDRNFMTELLHGIETSGIPAHAPIEQRWSSGSSSRLSPAHGPEYSLHCWVGIINYLPNNDNEMQRQAITQLFRGTYSRVLDRVGKRYNAVTHWAKLETPTTNNNNSTNHHVYDLVDVQLQLHRRYPIQAFNKLRAFVDPHNILSSPMMDRLLGKPLPVLPVELSSTITSKERG